MRQQINFYNGKIRRAQRASPLIYIAACVIASVALAIFWGLQQKNLLTREESLQKEIQASLAEARITLEKNNKNATPIPLDASLDGTLEILEKKVKLRETLFQAVDSQLARGAVSIAPFFIALAKNHRDGIWLTTIHLHRGKGIVSIRGKTVDSALVSTYLNQLSRNPDITKTGFNFLHFRIPSPTETNDKNISSIEKTDKTPEFLLTTDEDEIRELTGDESTNDSNAEQTTTLNGDLFKDSFQYIEQLKMMAR